MLGLRRQPVERVAAAVRLRDRTIDELCRLPLGKLLAELNDWKPAGNEQKIAGELLREIRNRVQFLVDVGLEYLTLSRPPRRSPAARRSGSGWPARSAADCAACSTCWTSRRSDCIRATIAGC